MQSIDYLRLSIDDIDAVLFSGFIRKQVVDKCIRKIDGCWVIVSDPFTDDWSEENYAQLVVDLKNTVSTGGLVCGAFENGILKGFCSVESEPIGSKRQYLDLSSLHVSLDKRACGIGRELFLRAAAFAKARGAHKLYISAHSAVESQAFYRAMGCAEAQEYNADHVMREPCDCQLEYVL